MPLFHQSEEFGWFWRIIPSFLDSSHFFLCLQRSGPRKPGKCEVRNQGTCEAYKQFHFREATSNRRIGSLLWHLGDNKRSKQPKKLPPIPFFFFLRVFRKVRLWNYNSDRLPTPSQEIGKKSEILWWVWNSDKGKWKISCSYVLKSTSYLGLAISAVGLDLSSPAHAVLPLMVITTGWHNQPHFTLLPTMEHPRPPTLPLPLLSC